jgi:hypothetical protein
MDWLEYPSKELWDSRLRWIEELNELCQGQGSYFTGEQSCALLGEVQMAFCTGAWIAVIILALAVIESQVKETELPEFKGNAKKMLHEIDASVELQKLRERRNALLHVDPENPAITLDQQWLNRKMLEQEARNAVKLMFETFYMSPGT